MTNNKIGKFGEELASKYLQKNGYSILDKNIYVGKKEIDIIAIKNNTLIFIEVKTRTSQCYGQGEEAIIGKKITFLNKAAEIFLDYNNII